MLLYKQLQNPSGLLLCLFPFVNYSAVWGQSAPESYLRTQAPSILWLSPPESPPFKLVPWGKSEVGPDLDQEIHITFAHILLARTESHVPHLPTGKAEKIDS